MNTLTNLAILDVIFCVSAIGSVENFQSQLIILQRLSLATQIG